MADVLVAVEEGEVALDLDAVLVEAPEDDPVAVVDFCLSLDLAVLPVGVDLVAVPVGLRELLHGLEAGRQAYLFELLHLFGVDVLLLLHLPHLPLVLLVLSNVQLLDELGLEGPPDADFDLLIVVVHLVHPILLRSIISKSGIFAGY